ncbi:MAG: hypothetical protein WCA38_11205 [Candidatus Acidiferrales bacterium]
MLSYNLASIEVREAEKDQKPQKAAEEQAKNQMLAALETEIALQKNRRELSNAIRAAETASDIQEPPNPTLETLLRYRAANVREFKDLLDILERIRRLRDNAA